ncbi:MAG TPA: transcriptional regulator [Streptosporangiaceae bacterium]|nr:transcriptional regulator [Streptosporangiaceae bacterium]
MAYASAPGELTLHGVRVLGFASANRIASRFRLDADAVTEALLDFEAYGWVRRTSFAGTSGWSITDAGCAENEARLAAELDEAGARTAVTRAHAEFVPLNRRLGTACTNWQIRPAIGDPLAVNDHTDWRWDERVLRELASLDKSFGRICDQLAGHLDRFSGYADRYSSALAKSLAGQRAWVDGTDRESCHLVWIQFHEDLLATLAIPRGSDT